MSRTVFTPGQVVERINTAPFLRGVTVGRKYVVLSHYKNNITGLDTVEIVDDNGTRAGYYASRFKAVDTPPHEEDTFILVLRREDGTLAPHTTPRTYSSAKQAKAVALSMAERHKGCEFLVFKAVAKSFAPKPVEPAAEYLPL